MEDLKNQAEPNLIIMLVGNKVDLCKENPNARQVSREEGMRLADENKLLFEETSAITATNVVLAFERLLEGWHFLILCLGLFFWKYLEISKREIPENPNKAVSLSQTQNGNKSFCKSC